MIQQTVGKYFEIWGDTQSQNIFLKGLLVLTIIINISLLITVVSLASKKPLLISKQINGHSLLAKTKPASKEFIKSELDTFVLIKRKKPIEERNFTREKLKVYKKPLTLVVHKVLFPKSKNISSIYFSIFLNSRSKKSFKARHLKFNVFQNRNKIPIQKIFVNKPQLSFESKKISGYLILNSKHLLQNQELVLKFSAHTIRKPLYLKIPFL